MHSLPVVHKQKTLLETFIAQQSVETKKNQTNLKIADVNLVKTKSAWMALDQAIWTCCYLVAWSKLKK